MGLDTYALQPFEQEDDVNEKQLMEARALRETHFKDLPGELIGGLFSGTGEDGSFRGKAYDADVEKLTGESLYQEEIDNESVKGMAECLNKAVRNGKKVMVEHDDHLPILAAWFTVAADNGYTVNGWW